jgi:hypothetical protein
MQVLRANPNQKSFGQRLNEGLGSGIQMLQEYQKMAEENAKQQKFAQQVQDLFGIDLSGMGQEGLERFATEAYKEKEKGNVAAEKLRGEKAEEVKTLQGALSSIDEMMNIRKKGNLGAGVGIWSSLGRGETARDKGAYETLGNSLISFASSIPIRNKVEFEKLAGHISDPSISDAEAEGILTKLRKIIEDSMSQHEIGEPSSKSKEAKPDLFSFIEE